MPYGSRAELPAAVKKLPAHGQDIYRASFNAAFKQYGDESRSHATAWAAVKNKYSKSKGKWVLKKEVTLMSGVIAKGLNGLTFDATARLLKTLDERGQRLLFIAAADSGPDKQPGVDPKTGRKWVAERIAPQFLSKMRSLAESGKLELVESHHSGLPLAHSVRVATNEELQKMGYQGMYDAFVPVFALDDNSPMADQLWKMADTGTLDREFSVGGSISEARIVFDNTLGGFVKEILDGNVDHIAVCRPGQAANPRTGLLGAMMKAINAATINWEEVPSMTKTCTCGQQVSFAEPLTKATCGCCGCEVEITPSDIDDANEDRAEYVWSTDFNNALADIKLKAQLPMLSELLETVIKCIMQDSTITDKNAAMKKAVDDFTAACDALGVPNGTTPANAEVPAQPLEMAATVENVLEKTGEGQAPVNQTAMQTGGRIMEMFKSLQGEGRDKVATLLGTTPSELESLTAADVFSKMAALDKTGQEALVKAFLPFPSQMAAGDLTSINTTMTTLDTLAKSLADAADKLSKAVEVVAAAAPAPVVETPAAVVEAAPPMALTAESIKALVVEAMAEGSKPVEEPAAIEKTLTPDEAKSLIATTVKEVMNKSLQPVSETPAPAGEKSSRERVIELVREKGPAGALDAIFTP